MGFFDNIFGSKKEYDERYYELDKKLNEEDLSYNEAYPLVKSTYKKMIDGSIRNDNEMNSFVENSLSKISTSDEVTDAITSFQLLENIMAIHLNDWESKNQTNFKGYDEIEQYHALATKYYEIARTKILMNIILKG